MWAWVVVAGAYSVLASPNASLPEGFINDPLSNAPKLTEVCVKLDELFAALPEIAANFSNTTELLQFSKTEGDRSGTPKNFSAFSDNLENGFWKDEHGCCTGHWSDLFFRPNPRVFWDGEPEETRSYVILADDIDSNGNIHWLATGIDSREHGFQMGVSGSCSWWQMLYKRCPKGKLPAATLELPNRWGWWRYTAFCPPDLEIHRYRIRVFAQREWNQRYLSLRNTGDHWRPVTRNSDDVVRQLMPGNAAIATIIGTFQRPKTCGGLPFKGGAPPGPIEGLVANYDFRSKTFFSMMEGAPSIVDIGKACGKPARFVSDAVHRRSSVVLDFVSGSGLAIPDVDLLLLENGDARNVRYTVAMEIKMRRTTCWVRLLNVNPTSNDGLYLCNQLNLFPTAAQGGTLSPNKWHHVVISASAADSTVQFFVDGKSTYKGKIPETNWAQTLGIRSGGDPSMRKEMGDNKLLDAPYMSFFNDCGKDCLCEGGGGQNSAGHVRSIQLYKRALNETDVEVLFQRSTTPPDNEENDYVM
eukprot:c25586_g1_i1.p1 GENE.c25586_g1_i1~~c25586_g1_i1.p1  ORF type:complete len:528 (-),score=84.49 c25586_g1_i1:372-1955(-)